MAAASILYWAFIFMNVIGFYLMREDKRRAKQNRYRISEKNLWLVAVFGGAIGAAAGMHLFRHKTKHLNFKFGFPILALIQLAVLAYFAI